MKKLYIILILSLIGCSGSKEFEDVPKPVGGDKMVRSVFQQSLGNVYSDVKGNTVTFLVSINRDGVIEQVGISNPTSSEYVNRTVTFALKQHIKFTPAVRNGKRVKANFEYDFTF